MHKLIDQNHGLSSLKKSLYSFLFLFLVIAACTSKKQDSGKSQKVITLQNEKKTTEYYTYKITYPDSISNPILADSLQQFAQASRDSFIQSLPADTSVYKITPWTFQIEFKKAFDSKRFTSYYADMYEYMGGAHGMPFTKTFTFDKQTQKLSPLKVFFKDSTALEPISKYAMDAVASNIYETPLVENLNDINKKWVIEGAAPTYLNYQSFVPARIENDKATGIEIIFSAYQVGPYAIGTPHAFIPDSIFYNDLKPTFRSAFKDKK